MIGRELLEEFVEARVRRTRSGFFDCAGTSSESRLLPFGILLQSGRPKMLKPLFAAVLSLGLGGCSALSQVLEFKHVALFEMKIDEARKVPVSISGLSGYSAYSVYKIDEKREGNSLIVLVHIHLSRNNESGRFNAPLSILDDVNELQFGNEKYTLWKRSAAP